MKALRPLVLALALVPVLVPAQPAAPASPGASASAPGPLRGPGTVPGPGPRAGRWGSGVTPGWGMMSPQERDQHRDAMRSARTYEDCRKAFDEHRALMEKRAAERGVRMPQPRRDACAGLPRP